MEKCLHSVHSITFGKRKAIVSFLKFLNLILIHILMASDAWNVCSSFFSSPNIEDAVQEWGRAFGTKMPH